MLRGASGMAGAANARKAEGEMNLREHSRQSRQSIQWLGSGAGGFKLMVTAIAFLTTACLSVGPALAVPIYQIDLDPGHLLYGNLKQADVPGCGSVACGPTATVNSFAYLQNRYPSIYGKKLIPDDSPLDGFTNYAELINTATALAGADYMNTQPPGGTTVANLIAGKRKWIEENAAGTTVFGDLSNPNWPYLWRNLMSGEDIELLFGFFDAAGNRLAGHFVTLAGMDWTDTDSDNVVDLSEAASLIFIDPADGTKKSHSFYQAGLNIIMMTDYNVGGFIDGIEVASTLIQWAITESPAPEPAMILIFMLGLASLGLARCRRAV